ncbi:AEC family transporter [Leptolyngbya sp. PCC 6406]|uniref:AEC family transporter n=1 Tax=Leptolyngbya sp. PCC 6406 TaxID=1173264 RepID=UPI0002ABF6FC|nr:AEC family transporter [Leptolyngbya sp. PCC 6406]
MWFLVRLYVPICAAVLVGALMSFGLSQPWIHRLSKRALHQDLPAWLGKFLFLIGVPISIVNFLHRANLSGGVFLAPLVAWGAMALALLCSRFWLRPQLGNWARPAQGTFSLAAMLGNTGYIGFPVVLLLPQLGPDYFGWALFYDVLGTLLGAYIVGVILAAQFGEQPGGTSRSWRATLKELFKNPTILAFILGLALRPVVFPELLDITLNGFAWSMVMLSLVLMGMRLQQLRSWGNLKPASGAVGIRMVLVPLVVGVALTVLGMAGPSRLVMVLQAGMPSAFATLVLSETYNLDRELAVTCVGISSVVLLLTLPLWLWGFCTW